MNTQRLFVIWLVVATSLTSVIATTVLVDSLGSDFMSQPQVRLSISAVIVVLVLGVWRLAHKSGVETNTDLHAKATDVNRADSDKASDLKEANASDGWRLAGFGLVFFVSGAALLYLLAPIIYALVHG